jgi:hypothetical protein
MGIKVKISLLKALDLFLWHQIQVLELLTLAFSVPLTLLKVGVLGCVEMDVLLFVGQLWRELTWGG